MEAWSDEHGWVHAAFSRRAGQRLRRRPRRLRNRALGAGDLALRVDAFDRGAAGLSACALFQQADGVKLWRPCGGRGIGFAGGILGGLAGLSGVLPTLWASVRGWGKDERRGVFQI